MAIKCRVLRPLIASTVISLRSAYACPLCTTQTGVRVRREIFGPDLWWNLFATALPFLIFFSVALWVHSAPANARSPEDPS